MSNKFYSVCLFITTVLSGAMYLSIPIKTAYAGSCSPGIPCTDYTLTANPTAGTTTTLNGPKTGKTSPYTERSCDGNFMNQIVSNAFLGASRDVIMSEQLINKPDSVLAYTCFDQILARTAQNGGILSESQTFGAGTSARGFALKAGNDQGGDGYDGSDQNDGQISPDSGSGLVGVPPPSCSQSPCETYTVNLTSYDSIATTYDQRLDRLLQEVAMTSLTTYLNNNFNHNYLGGSSSLTRTTSAISAASYTCNDMNRVWLASQCSDFGEYDKFRTFSNLVLQDPRAFPTGCSASNIAPDSNDIVDTTNVDFQFSHTISKPCPDADGNNTGSTANTGITNKQIDVANNCNYSYADFDILEPLMGIIKSPVLSTTPSAQDAAKLMSGHPIVCSAPIPTGIVVISYDHALASIGPLPRVPILVRFVHNDHVCPNPGCHYVPGTPGSTSGSWGTPYKVPASNSGAGAIVPGNRIDLMDITSVPTISGTGFCWPL